VETAFTAVREMRLKNPLMQKSISRSARCRAVWRRWRASVPTE
jgi:hypothetical protein